MGKAYANRKSASERPGGDLYHTPKSLTTELLKVEKVNNVWEPASGYGAITDVFKEHNIEYRATDILTGTNFLKTTEKHNGDIMTNPPFSLWDKFVSKGKELSANKTIMLGRTNYFGTQSRFESGIWDTLKNIYVFTRYVDYQTPLRDDGLFHVGALCTGWFVWEQGYKGKPQIDFIDVQKYTKLGQYKRKFKNIHTGESKEWGQWEKTWVYTYGIEESLIEVFPDGKGNWI